MTAAVVTAVGALVWIVGYAQVSGRASAEAQIAPLNLAVLGVLVTGASPCLWFFRGRRAVQDRRRLLLGVDPDPAPCCAALDLVTLDQFVGSVSFFHRADCAMADERGWSAAPRAAHEDAGRTPCGVCAP
jgi:hypothetical protein